MARSYSALLTLVVSFCSVASAQTDSVRGVLDQTPSEPIPTSARVSEMAAILMPNGHPARWKPCDQDGARGWGCDSLVKHLQFDPAAKMVWAVPCYSDGLLFRIEQEQRDVVLIVPALERQYIMAQPNRCNRSCPEHPQCFRLTAKHERRSANTDIYLYKDTIR